MNQSRIAIERKRLGLSQCELADKVGISQKSISKYERGDRRPTYETIAAMANLFGTSVDYLLGLSDQRNSPPEKEISSFTQKLLNIPQNISLTETEFRLISIYRQLSSDDQTILLGKALDLLRTSDTEETTKKKAN